jgi:hypothetical protein
VNELPPNILLDLAPHRRYFGSAGRRVFYDVSGSTFEVLAIVAKSEDESWLAQIANPE